MLAFAPRRKHASCIPGATLLLDAVGALQYFNGHAALGELDGARQPCNAGANDGDAHELPWHVQLAMFAELFGHLGHAVLASGVCSDLMRDAHGAEFRAAHRTKV